MRILLSFVKIILIGISVHKRNFLPSATVYGSNVTLHRRLSLHFDHKSLLIFAKKFLITYEQKFLSLMQTSIIFLLFIFMFLSAGICLADDILDKKSTHFIVYYEGVPEDFVDTVIKYAEGYYDELTEKLGFRRFDYWTWENRAKIYIYPDQETYAKKTKQPSWSGGAVSYAEKTIWTYPRESGFFDSLLPHEIGHIVFREVVGSGKGGVPLWLEEGVASYLEEAKRVGAQALVLRSLRDKTFIHFSELNKITVYDLRQRGDVDLFYAESVCVVNYLIEKYGVAAFNDFCKKIKDGKSFDRALSYSYFYIRSSGDLAEFWEQYLNDKLKNIK